MYLSNLSDRLGLGRREEGSLDRDCVTDRAQAFYPESQIAAVDLENDWALLVQCVGFPDERLRWLDLGHVLLLFYTACMAAQPMLLFESACSCGAGLIAKAGLCLVYYRRDWHSKKYFGGYRDQVLERDGYRCRVCNRGTRVVNHLRQLQIRTG